MINANFDHLRDIEATPVVPASENDPCTTWPGHGLQGTVGPHTEGCDDFRLALLLTDPGHVTKQNERTQAYRGDLDINKQNIHPNNNKKNKYNNNPIVFSSW